MSTISTWCRETAQLCEYVSLVDCPPGSLVFGEAHHWGVGLRCDATVPHFGTIALIHWLVAPYSGEAAGGIVEDCRSARIRHGRVCNFTRLEFEAISPGMALVEDRASRRNLVCDGFLMGVRGWDIPHDSHMAVTDIRTWQADITGADLPRLWSADWRLSVYRPDSVSQLVWIDGSARIACS